MRRKYKYLGHKKNTKFGGEATEMLRLFPSKEYALGYGGLPNKFRLLLLPLTIHQSRVAGSGW